MTMDSEKKRDGTSDVVSFACPECHCIQSRETELPDATRRFLRSDKKIVPTPEEARTDALVDIRDALTAIAEATSEVASALKYDLDLTLDKIAGALSDLAEATKNDAA